MLPMSTCNTCVCEEIKYQWSWKEVSYLELWFRKVFDTQNVKKNNTCPIWEQWRLQSACSPQRLISVFSEYFLLYDSVSRQWRSWLDCGSLPTPSRNMLTSTPQQIHMWVTINVFVFNNAQFQMKGVIHIIFFLFLHENMLLVLVWSSSLMHF